MKDLNKIILGGRLTKEPELRYSNSGDAVLSFSIAVNGSKKVGDQWQDDPSFFNVSYWGKSAESITQYMTKGRKIYLEGELKLDKWQSNDGSPRQAVKVNAKMVWLGEEPKGRQGNDEFSHDVYPEAKPKAPEGHAAPFVDDEIPF